jgi:hypothetical protein
MFHIVVGRPATSDLRDVLDQLPDATFQKITRSTVPLLAFWRRPLDRLNEVTQSLRIPLPSDGILCFEYPEDSGVPRSTASYSDVMYVSDDCRIAFEAKWTESRYEDVESWLKRGATEHRRRVLNAWLSRIARLTTIPYDVDSCSKLVYQAIHRTASACSGSAGTAVVIYQCFCDEAHQHSHVTDDLRDLVRVCRPASGLSFYVQRIPLTQTRAFHELARRSEGYTPRQRAAATRLALWDSDLFQFGPPQLELVIP